MNDPARAGDGLLNAWYDITCKLWNPHVHDPLAHSEQRVLNLLANHSEQENPLTASDLIVQTRLYRNQIDRALSDLESHGLIRRERASDDRRRFYIRLTEAGSNAYLKEHATATAIVSRLVDQIGVERAQRLVGDIQEILDALEDILPHVSECP